MKTIEIRITPAMQITALVAGIAGGIALLASQAPEIQRYLKVRGM